MAVQANDRGIEAERATHIQQVDDMPMYSDNTLLPVSYPLVKPTVGGNLVFTEEPKKEIKRDYDHLIYQYDWDARLMRAIFTAESQMNPNAINRKDKHKGCSGSYGIAQLGCVWFGKYGLTRDNWNDPETNIRVAYEVYKIQGLNAWGVYSSGKYKVYY